MLTSLLLMDTLFQQCDERDVLNFVLFLSEKILTESDVILTGKTFLRFWNYKKIC